VIFKVKKTISPDQHPDVYEIETPKEFDDLIKSTKNFFLKFKWHI
jgi:hypothetical protein